MIGLITGLISSPAHADHGSGVTFPCGTSGSYTVSGGVLTGNSDCAGNLNIDSSVVEIADYAFRNNANLAAINIPGSVITIGVQAFNSASATSLTLGEGIIEIKSNAFSSLNTSGSSLDITIPDTVITLGDAAFQQNTIGSLIIGDSIVNIPTQAFYSNAGGGPTSVEFGSSVKNIGSSSFVGYRGRSLYLPEGIETIASEAFADAFINALSLPVSLISIANDAFLFSPNTTVYCGTNPDISNYIFPEPNNAKVCGNLVYFDGNGSNRNDSAQQVSSNAVNLTTFNWRKTGSAFVRWTSNRDGTGVQYANGALFPFLDRITTLYAQWGVRETVDDSAITLGDSICDLLSTASDGSAGKPYLVGSALQLAEVNDCNDGETYKYYRQIADIDLTPTSDGSQDGWNDTRATEEGLNQFSTGGWVPIGNVGADSGLFAERSFSGSYDGNDKSITGMKINRNSYYQGLFGYTNIAEIKNLTIGSPNKTAAGSIRNSGGRVGAVVGEASYTNFKNVHVKNIDIMGSGRYVGGLAGYSERSDAIDVSYSGNITSSTAEFIDTGGIFGYSNLGNIKRAKVVGNLTCDFENVSDSEDRGWITGRFCAGIGGRFNNGAISQVLVTSDVTASNRAGGIVGESFSVLIDSAEFNGHIYGSKGIGNNLEARGLGGIAGYFEEGVISDVVSNGDVAIDASMEGVAYSAGGIAGDTEEAGIQNSVSNGDVVIDASMEGRAYLVGGIVGEAKEGVINNVVSNSNVLIDTSFGGESIGVGGIVGALEDGGSLTSSLAIGNVEVTGLNSSDYGTRDLGGAVGSMRTEGTFVFDVKVIGNLTVSDGENIGGLVGSASSGVSVSRSSFSGALKANFGVKTDAEAHIGGAIGSAYNGVQLSSTSVTSLASVSADAPFERVGGLIGYARNRVVITDSYNRAPVAGYDKVGGIIGLAGDKSVSVYNTYNTGTVTPGTGAEDPDNDVFAAGGNFKEGLSLSNTFDIQTTGATTSATGVVGNATAAMKTKSTFEALGFDFSSSAPIWAIDTLKNDGYPYLIETSLSRQPVVAPVAVAPVTITAAPVAIVPSVETFKLDKFSKNSANISKANKAKIALYAKKLKAGGYSKITVRSFTKNENTVLANKRAMAVTNLLKKYGVKVVIRNEGITRKSNSLNDHVRLIGKKN